VDDDIFNFISRSFGISQPNGRCGSRQGGCRQESLQARKTNRIDGQDEENLSYQGNTEQQELTLWAVPLMARLRN
jgi:hypothetical protein